MLDQSIVDNAVPNPKDWTEDERRLLEANAMDMDVFATRIFEQTQAAPAWLKRDQLEELESVIQRDSIRRAALLFATMTGNELCEKIQNDRDFAVSASAVHLRMKEAKERYHELADLIDNVSTRISIALCGREDMREVLQEGEAG